MDPVFAIVAELWWLGPAAAGGGAASIAGIRYGRRHRARTLEYAAARHELNAARARLQTARAQLKSAQAALLVTRSERQSGRRSAGEVDAVRRSVGDARRELRSAQTAVRGRRVQVRAARTMLRGMPRGIEHLPTTRLLAAHNAVLARWMEYETDPGKAIAFPAMSDPRVPATAALLTAMDRARWLRPDPERPLTTPEAFAHYRAAVAELEAAFHAAESEAWRAAGATGGPAGPIGQPGASRAPSAPPERGAWEYLAHVARSAAGAAAAVAAEKALDAMARAAKRPPRDDGPAARRAPRPFSD